jgi:hypothetical protein
MTGILGQSNYSPQYFDVFYDVDKLFFQGNHRKYAFFATKSFENLDLLHGFNFQTIFLLSSFLKIKASLLGFQRYNFDKKNNIIKENYLNLYSEIYFSPISFMGIKIVFAKNDIKQTKLFDKNSRWLLRGNLDFYAKGNSTFSFYIQNNFIENIPKTNYSQTKPEDFSYKSQILFSLGGMATVGF